MGLAQAKPHPLSEHMNDGDLLPVDPHQSHLYIALAYSDRRQRWAFPSAQEPHASSLLTSGVT